MLAIPVFGAPGKAYTDRSRQDGGTESPWQLADYIHNSGLDTNNLLFGK